MVSREASANLEKMTKTLRKKPQNNKRLKTRPYCPTKEHQ